MIGSIRGILRASRPPIALVECGGVGYEILAPMLVHARLAAIGEEVFLHTEMVVREDSQTLYGFGDRSERELFRRLIRISGVGAKMTLGMMNEMPAADIISALKNGDKDSLTRLPGIGRKTAERLVVELKDDNFFFRLRRRFAPSRRRCRSGRSLGCSWLQARRNSAGA